MKKILVREKKGHSFRLLLLSEKSPKVYRAITKKYPALVVGDLLLAKNLKTIGDLIENMTVITTVPGSSNKQRVLVDPNSVSVGDLIDGVPILRLGATFNIDQEKKAYAYFS